MDLGSAPRLSIVIPTLNRAGLVARAIESALGQTYSSIEVIVSNNGSTDDTRAVIDRYRDSPRIRIFHRKDTIPATAHGNFLLEQARGEFFVGLSDDDWLEPDFAEKTIALFDRRASLSFVWTGCLIHYADAVTPALTGPEIESGTQFLAAFLAGERNVCWCACVTRTRDLRRIGPIPPDVICGDMFYWTKLAAAGDVGCVSEALSHYVCYRDLGDGSAGGTPVLKWAADSQRWVCDMLATCRAVESGSNDHERLARNAAVFLSRTTANQFVWQALRGESRVSLLKSIKPALPFLRGHDRSPWIRVIAAIIAPRRLLRSRMLAEARRKARLAAKQARSGRAP